MVTFLSKLSVGGERQKGNTNAHIPASFWEGGEGDNHPSRLCPVGRQSYLLHLAFCEQMVKTKM